MPTEIIIKIPTLGSIPQFANEFVSQMGGHKIFAFYGPMGVGKTTLIKAICKHAGVIDTVNSPTFALVNEYKLPGEKLIYHFDFYRINKLEEVFDMGYEDYFYSDKFCFIEWPELIAGILPDDSVAVYLEELPDGSRIARLVFP